MAIRGMDGFDGTDGYDFSINPVLGIRGFRIMEDGSGTLTGWSYQTPWEPGVNQAECGRRHYTSTCQLLHNHDNWGSSARRWTAPTKECIKRTGCEDIRNMEACDHGFWAYFDDIEADAIRQDTTTAVISASGRVLVGEKGFRAEKAQIEAIHLADTTTEEPEQYEQDVLKKRVELYGLVPVITVVGWAPAFIAYAQGFSALQAVGVALLSMIVMLGGLHGFVQKFTKQVTLQRTRMVVKTRVPHPHREAIEKRYPNVLVYTDKEEMFSHFPITQTEILGAESDKGVPLPKTRKKK